MKTHTITSDSPHLASVRDLWRANSATLGFFPQGAFEDLARQQGIIIATDDDGTLAGYLAFRRTRRRAVIVHLCVDCRFRGRGVTRLLFSTFREATSDLAGASVTCRSDYDASDLWPRLGFAALREEPARELGKCLKRWWLDYGHPDLFTSLNPTVLAVIDANVFFDLANDSEPRYQESTALRADWLTEAYTLAVTPEVYNEIDRCGDETKKERSRRFVPAFSMTAARPGDLQAAVERLSSILGVPQSRSDESDHRQLAHAISVGATFFVTRDGDFLDARTTLKATFGIDVVRPSELVCRYDEEARPTAYAPERLDGSALTIRRVRSSELERVVRLFQNFPRGETNGGLPVRLREALARPDVFNVDLMHDTSESMLGLEVSNGTSAGVISIAVLRVSPGILGSTLARHRLWCAVLRGVSTNADFVQFLDGFAPDGIEDALSDIGFVRAGHRWVKPLLRGTLGADALINQLATVVKQANMSDAVVQACQSLGRSSAENVAAASHLEKVLWPARVIGSGLPCFVVPIKPRWAAELFDTRSAAGRLFGANPALLLRFENAYYRSARPMILRAPGRILWYSSDDPAEPWAKHLCGTSILNRIVVDSPRAIFQEFKRYGVFSWEDVASLNSGTSGRIMAFTFSHSALLQKPISFAKAANFLFSRTGKRYTFQSPVELDEGAWMELIGLSDAENEGFR